MQARIGFDYAPKPKVKRPSPLARLLESLARIFSPGPVVIGPHNCFPKFKKK